MSSFFKNFPATSYRFGNRLDPVSFQNLSVYIDLVDLIKDNVASKIILLSIVFKCRDQYRNNVHRDFES